MEIKFGNLKPEIKSNFYLGGNARYLENDRYVVAELNFPHVNVWDGDMYRYVNLNDFESYEIIGG